jgi:hypothetical protein
MKTSASALSSFFYSILLFLFFDQLADDSQCTVMLRQPIIYGIHIWTWRRLASLQRLMRSITAASYLVHPFTFASEQASKYQLPTIDLIFHIDGHGDPEILYWILTQYEANSGINKHEKSHFHELHESINLYEKDPLTPLGFTSLKWPYGKVLIDIKRKNLGLPEVVFEGVASTSPYWQHTFAILLEDDLAVSPYYWHWVTYSSELLGRNPQVIASAFHVPRLNEMAIVDKDFQAWSPQKSLQNEAHCHQHLFTYDVPCSWGSCIKTSKFIDVAEYYRRRQQLDTAINILPSTLRATHWKNSWKKFMMEFICLKRFVYLYPCTEQQKSFATNYMEYGVHWHPNGTSIASLRTWHDIRYTVPLIESERDFEEIWPELVKSRKDICHIDAFLTVAESTAIFC